MNRQITKLAVAAIVLLSTLIVGTTYWQTWAVAGLADRQDNALAQELGLIGAAGLLLVYMLFVARGFRIALLTDDGFSKLLAVGLTFAFALQTFIIIGGIVGIIPLTGITMPFVSYGGSSVVANFILLALLLLVSNRANEHTRGLS